MRDEVTQYESHIKQNVRQLDAQIELQDWKEVANIADAIKEDAEEITAMLIEEVIVVPSAEVQVKPMVELRKTTKEELEASIKDLQRQARRHAKIVLSCCDDGDWESSESEVSTLLDVLKDMSAAMDELQELEDAEPKFEFRKLFALPSAQLCFWHDAKTGGFAVNVDLNGKPEEDGIQWLTGDVTMSPMPAAAFSAVQGLRFWWRGTNEPASQPASKFYMLNLKEGLEVLCRFGWFVRERSRDPKEISIEEFALVGALNDGPFRTAAHDMIHAARGNSWMASTDKSLNKKGN